MQRNAEKDTIEISKDEYKILKEIYRTVKRQKFLFRLEEAEENYRAGKVKSINADSFAESI